MSADATSTAPGNAFGSTAGNPAGTTTAATPVKDLAGLANAIRELRSAASRMVRGQERVIEDFLLCAGSRGHLLILGVPGTGKTMLAKVLGRLTGLQAGRIQFTQDLLPADITGHFIFDREQGKFVVRKGPVFCNILLADEINRAPSKTQSALLEAMEEHQVTIEGRTFPLPASFLVMATMNPVDLEGVHRLPAAQMDRFTIQSRVDYPGQKDETAFLTQPPGPKLGQLQALAGDVVQRLHTAASQVKAHPDVVDYLVRLVRATRSHPQVLLGLSPRASEQILDVAKTYAVLNQRDYVVPKDVQSAFERCSTHRIHLRPDAEVDTTVDQVVANVLRETATPETRGALGPDGGSSANARGRSVAVPAARSAATAANEPTSKGAKPTSEARAAARSADVAAASGASDQSNPAGAAQRSGRRGR